jgi:hypothetical protein
MPSVISTYPRTRPVLPDAQREVYEAEYAINRSGDGLLYRGVAKLESWMHHKISAEQVTGSILELGAGGLTHISLEPTASRYDVVEPVSEIVYSAENFPKVTRYFDSYEAFVAAAEAGDLEYRKILSVAVLEHLPNLPAVVAASALALNDDGSFHAGIPMEGGLLWESTWRMSTGVAYRLRNGFSYAPFMAHEHINSAADIEEVVGCFFSHVDRSRFPLRGKHASLYAHLRAIGPRKDLARKYLAGLAAPAAD